MSCFRRMSICGTPLFRPAAVSSEEEKQQRDPYAHVVLPTIVRPLDMTKIHKDILHLHFRKTLLEQQPDIFHKVMLMCMESSPKIDKLAAFPKFCHKDLASWPKLNVLCSTQKAFYTALIEDYHLDGCVVTQQAFRIGKVHFNHAHRGLKPHFFDIYMRNMETSLQSLQFAYAEEKEIFIAAFRQLNLFMVETMNLSYLMCQQKQLHT